MSLSADKKSIQKLQRIIVDALEDVKAVQLLVFNTEAFPEAPDSWGAMFVPGGPADAAGLKPGDVVVEFNAQAIGDEGDLRSREAALPPGTKVQVRALRVGVEFVTEVELIQRPKAQR